MDMQAKLDNTRELRRRLLKVFEDHEQGKITNAAARARAIVAREILDTIKVEMIAARVGSRSFAPVSLTGDETTILTIEAKPQ